MKQISIDKLNEHLFESIEMLKNSSDPEASPQEKMDIETAKSIADLGKVVVEGYKVKIQALNMIRNCENPNLTRQAVESAGLLKIEEGKQ